MERLHFLQEHFLHGSREHVAVAFGLVNLPTGQRVDVRAATGTEQGHGAGMTFL